MCEGPCGQRRSGKALERGIYAMKMAKVGILMDEAAAEKRWDSGVNVFQSYVGEILAHRGIPFQWVRSIRRVYDHFPCDVLLVAAVDETKENLDLLWRYMNRGGIVISFAGLNGMAQRLGHRKGFAVGPGYAESPFADRPLRFLQAVPWVPAEGAAAAEPISLENIGVIRAGSPSGSVIGAELQQFAVGKGALDRFSVDLVSDIVRMQQGGKPVLEDGPPAPDGTAMVNDGVLKADDAIELDYEHDRVATETGIPVFMHPYADLWRDRLIGHLLRRTAERGLSLPFLAYWPDGTEQVAQISHDSDYNIDEHGRATLQLLKECGIQSTWCMLEPGYSKELYKEIAADGHELAFHYNAVHADNGYWGEEEFKRQFAWLKEATGLEKIVTNKNHLTRMEGWGDLYRWCESCGIESEQSRGGSKKGNLGFTFGTCHPFFPIALTDEKNRLYDVLAVNFLTPDMELPKWGDMSMVVPLLEQVANVQGVAHFLVHQFHIYHREEVRNSIRYTVQEARKRGFEFWTNERINRWVRARRNVRIAGLAADGRPLAECLPEEGGSAVAWVPIARGHASVGDAGSASGATGAGAASPEDRAEASGGEYAVLYGVLCRKYVLSP